MPNQPAQVFRCPVCGKQFYETDTGVLMPFCTARCKQIDAVRWLDERYSLPIEREENINFDNTSSEDRAAK